MMSLITLAKLENTSVWLPSASFIGCQFDDGWCSRQ